MKMLSRSSLVVLLISLSLALLAGMASGQQSPAKPEKTSAPAAPAQTDRATDEYKRATGQVGGQSAPAPNYTLSEVQRLRLREKQLQFFLAQRDMQTAGGEFNAECERVKADNHLPNDASCDVRDLTLKPPPTVATK